jgi:hypothetical protein
MESSCSPHGTPHRDQSADSAMRREGKRFFSDIRSFRSLCRAIAPGVLISCEQEPGPVEERAVCGREEAIEADFVEPSGEHVLEVTADKLFGEKLCGLPLPGSPVLVAFTPKRLKGRIETRFLNQAAEKFIHAAVSEKSEDRLRSLAKGLGSIADRLDAGLARRAAETAVDKILESGRESDLLPDIAHLAPLEEESSEPTLRALQNESPEPLGRRLQRPSSMGCMNPSPFGT